MKRSLKNILWLAPPLGLAALGRAVMVYTEGHNLTFKVVDLRSAPDSLNRPKGNTISIGSKFQHQYKRPHWWHQDLNEPGFCLSIVAASVEDSQQHRVSVTEIYQYDYTAEKSIQHISVLKPQGKYDLSRGGTLRVRLAVTHCRVEETPYSIGEVILPLQPQQ